MVDLTDRDTKHIKEDQSTGTEGYLEYAEVKEKAR